MTRDFQTATSTQLYLWLPRPIFLTGIISSTSQSNFAYKAWLNSWHDFQALRSPIYLTRFGSNLDKIFRHLQTVHVPGQYTIKKHRFGLSTMVRFETVSNGRKDNFLTTEPLYNINRISISVVYKS